MDRVPLQCSRMAVSAIEYCDLIDRFDSKGHEHLWVKRMEKILPRLHVAVIALVPLGDHYDQYRLPDDDQRCELYMQLHHVLQSDQKPTLVYGGSHLQQQICDHLADDFTDIYFDLKFGLGLLELDPVQAVHVWQCSFYLHWGKHLLDAECWLHALGVGEEPLPFLENHWPSLNFAQA